MDQAKIPIKVAEISINKFNDQIYQKITQLRTFRISQSNTATLSDLEKLRKDAVNCLRVVKQLKQLLIEIDHLKTRTREEDHEKFDELTSKRRQEALKEIQLYQDMKPIDKLNELSHHATCNLDNESDSIDLRKQNVNIQLQIDDREIRKRELESREALLREFENLQTECESIANLFKNVSELVAEQAPMVDKIEENVEETEHHVEEGTRQLQQALKYKKTMYPLLGGLVGAAMLGPVGLIAGIKAGSAATLCGGLCGYAGGKILKKANTPTEPTTPISDIDVTHKIASDQQVIEQR